MISKVTMISRDSQNQNEISWFSSDFGSSMNNSRINFSDLDFSNISLNKNISELSLNISQSGSNFKASSKINSMNMSSPVKNLGKQLENREKVELFLNHNSIGS